MKLYYSPLACSLADHIALQESGASFECEAVDLKTRLTASGAQFAAVTGKGYVPALVLDSGEVLTENIAILDWIAVQYPALRVEGALGRTRVLEALSYIATELHRSFKPMWHHGADIDKVQASLTITALLNPFVANLKSEYLFGDSPSVADFYLFVMLLWARRFHVHVPQPLGALRIRIATRPATRTAMIREGLHDVLRSAGLPDAA